MDEDRIPPAEAARDRRRDRDAEAQARAGMRTGLAKQFKQVLDTQRKRADADLTRRRAGRRRAEARTPAEGPGPRLAQREVAGDVEDDVGVSAGGADEGDPQAAPAAERESGPRWPGCRPWGS